MLDLWPYEVGLKERVAAIEKELQAPEAKLAIRAAVGAGRHTIVQRLSASMDLAVIEFPSFDDLDAPLHGLVQLASHAGTLDLVLDAATGRSSAEDRSRSASAGRRGPRRGRPAAGASIGQPSRG